jgi:F-type H+-transporting ATPase subunit delta
MAILSNKNIASAIYESFIEKGKDLPFDKVVQFLVRKKLFSKRKAILRELEKIENEKKGIINAKVYTSTPLKEDFKNTIKSALKNKYKSKEALLKEIIDKSILGGIKIEVGDEVIDMTVLGRLTKLQEHLTK